MTISRFMPRRNQPVVSSQAQSSPMHRYELRERTPINYSQTRHYKSPGTRRNDRSNSVASNLGERLDSSQILMPQVKEEEDLELRFWRSGLIQAKSEPQDFDFHSPIIPGPQLKKEEETTISYSPYFPSEGDLMNHLTDINDNGDHGSTLNHVSSNASSRQGELNLISNLSSTISTPTISGSTTPQRIIEINFASPYTYNTASRVSAEPKFTSIYSSLSASSRDVENSNITSPFTSNPSSTSRNVEEFKFASPATCNPKISFMKSLQRVLFRGLYLIYYLFISLLLFPYTVLVKMNKKILLSTFLILVIAITMKLVAERSPNMRAVMMDFQSRLERFLSTKADQKFSVEISELQRKQINRIVAEKTRYLMEREFEKLRHENEEMMKKLVKIRMKKALKKTVELARLIINEVQSGVEPFESPKSG
ncbi:hypothetical protein G9A89_014562 [Geosiphon pyriformis]|nr:hypothetical protein G9A89_014562 [Geosiphon pyriformis]